MIRFYQVMYLSTAQGRGSRSSCSKTTLETPGTQKSCEGVAGMTVLFVKRGFPARKMGYPFIARCLLLGTIPFFNGWWSGVPLFQETSICLNMVEHCSSVIHIYIYIYMRVPQAISLPEHVMIVAHLVHQCSRFNHSKHLHDPCSSDSWHVISRPE